MRSTPWPNDTLRTVNEARVPPRCSPITTPSKIWMRSLSPSRTFTCTRTVSPDLIAGRSASCDFSTSSIAPISRSFIALCDQLAQNVSFLVVQGRSGQQIRPPREGPADGLALAPLSYLGMVAGQQHLRHSERHRISSAPPADDDLRRPRIVGKIKEPA